MLLAFESGIGREVNAKEAIVTFMPEYAAYLLNRGAQGKDGKTSYERCKGKRATVLGIEFGEKLLYKIRPKEKDQKILDRWQHGIFVGIRRRSGELWILVKARSLQ